MSRYLRFDPYLLALILLTALFVYIKIPYLSLPYYWDEAWVYGPAVRMMEANELSLMPDAIPPYYSRGHPLLFHFMGALWMRMFGTSPFSGHLFALFLSLGLIIALYAFGTLLHSKTVGILASTVLVLQPIFLAQSVLLLPEVQLSLFSLLAVGFYIRKNWVWYMIFATAALFTKETGIVVVATTGIWFLAENLYKEKSSFSLKHFLLRVLYLAIPVILIAAFFLLQKKMHGWYFFPEHIDYLNNDSRSFANKLESFAAYLFIYWGRNFLTALLVVALSLHFFYKRFRNNQLNIPLMILGTYIVLFLLVSSKNFYSDRYTMAMMAPFILITVILSVENIRKKILLYLVFTAYLLVQVFVYIPQKTSSDHNLGYADAVKISQEAVQYCLDQKYFNKKIFTHFLMIHNLTNPNCGYISEKEIFRDATASYSPDTELCIFTNLEGQEDHERIRSEGRFRLVKRFEKGNAWAEIYKAVR